MLQKNTITEVPPDSPGFYLNVFLVRKASGGFKRTERSHLRTSLSYVYYKLSSEYCQKRQLRVQDRSAGCVLSLSNISQRQEVSQVCLRKQGLSVPSTHFRSEHSPSGLYSFGAYRNRLPPPSGDFGYSISRRLVSSPSRPSSSTLPSVSATEYGRTGGIHSEPGKVQTGPSTGHPVPRSLVTPGSGENVPPRVQGSGDHNSSVRVILPTGSYHRVAQFMGSLSWASGLIPLGRLYLRPLQRHFHSLGLTNRFSPPCQSDQQLSASLLRQWQDLFFLTSPGVGCPYGGFSSFGFLDLFGSPAPYQWFGAQGGTFYPPPLGFSAPGPSSFDCFGQHYSSLLYQQTRRTHSTSLLRLVVDLFKWLQAQDIILRARHIPGCLNVIADRLSRPNQPISTEWSLHSKIVDWIFQFWGTPEVDMFATVHNICLLQFMSPTPEPQALAVDALSQDWQGRSMYMFPPFLLLSKVI